MNNLNKKNILELIDKYGIEEIEKLIDLKKEILNYIKDTKKIHAINVEPKKIVYNEDNKQIFTNQRTSIFCLNEKILNFNNLKLSSESFSKQIELVKEDEISKYFEKGKIYLGDSYYTDVSLVNSNGFVYYKIFTDLTTISLNEYKLIKLLLKNPKMYAACKSSTLYVEGENGYAYVLGEKSGCQTIF